MKIAIFTCITGGKDQLLRARTGVDAFCITDEPLRFRKTQGWTVLPTVRTTNNARRTSRWHKCNPHLIPELQSYDFTIWVDGNMALNLQPEALIQQTQAFPISCRPHHVRDCIYNEAEVVIRLDYDKPDLVTGQVSRYRKAGFPSRRGLHETGLLVRRSLPEVARFNELWWSEIEQGSQRDQLSFDFCLWKLDMACGAIDRTAVTRFDHLKETDRRN